jgi:hypothetical protein
VAARGTGADFSTFFIVASHACVDPVSTYELEAIIESPNAIDADQMSRKEVKTAFVLAR